MNVGRMLAGARNKLPTVGKIAAGSSGKLDSLYRAVGGIGKEVGPAQQLARGRSRTLIGGGAIAGLGLIGQGRGRSVGISSGANGPNPGSMGGYTG